jgi:hypothetical protein
MLSMAAALILVTSATAQTEYDSFFYIAASADPFDYCLHTSANQISTVYLCLGGLVNPDFGDIGPRPVQFVGGFECRFGSSRNVEVLGISFPVPATSVELNGSYMVAYSEPVPVVEDGSMPVAVLASIEVLYTGRLTSVIDAEEPITKSPQYCDNPTGEVYAAEPLDFSSIEGFPSYIDAEDPADPLIAGCCSYGDRDYFRLLFMETIVAAPSDSWGAVKAMYR